MMTFNFDVLAFTLFQTNTRFKQPNYRFDVLKYIQMMKRTKTITQDLNDIVPLLKHLQYYLDAVGYDSVLFIQLNEVIAMFESFINSEHKEYIHCVRRIEPALKRAQAIVDMIELHLASEM